MDTASDLLVSQLGKPTLDQVLPRATGWWKHREAETDEEALTFLEQRSVGLVLMDVNMPGIGGIRAAEQIRSRFPEVLVVLLSIYQLAELPAAAASCGAKFCHKERFGPDELEALWDGRAREQT